MKELKLVLKENEKSILPSEIDLKKHLLFITTPAHEGGYVTYILKKVYRHSTSYGLSKHVYNFISVLDDFSAFYHDSDTIEIALNRVIHMMREDNTKLNEPINFHILELN